jgi:putative hemolysin
MLLKIPILFLMILLNGVFAMAELAVIGARRTKLQAASANGDAGAKAALALLHDSGRFLSTVSIGITVIGIVVATVEGDSFVQPLVDVVVRVPGLQPYAHALSLALIVTANTLLTVVFGELVPKRIAIGRPEAIASKLAGVMTVVSRIVTPAEWLLSGLSSLVLRLLPVPHAAPSPVTDEEITLLMRQGTAAGAFEAVESAIVNMVLRLGDRRIDALMTPRTQIEMLDLEDGWEVNREKIAESSFSRFPVVEGGPETVVGILQMKDLALAAFDGQGQVDIRAHIRPPLYVPNTLPALKLLEMLKESGAALALVVDEYGDLDGLITQHDLLQALVGDIASQDEDEDRPVVRRDDGSWLVAGLTPIDEVKDAVGLSRLPDEESGDFHTLGGFVMARMKRVPKVADHIDVGGWRFEVVDMDGHRVDKVMIVPPKTDLDQVEIDRDLL